MRRGFGRTWFVAGLALLGATLGGRPEARADLTSLGTPVGTPLSPTPTTGITISGGYRPTTGDPPYQFVFTVTENPGYSTVSPYTNPYFFIHPMSFTIYNLVGVTPPVDGVGGSLTGQPGSNYGDPNYWTRSISQTWSDYPYASDVTWSFLGSQTIAATNQPVVIGQFTVQTTVNFATAPPVPSGQEVNYAFSIQDDTGQTSGSGGGQIILTDLTAVPEPASSTIVLLVGGAAGIAGLVTRARRRQAARMS